MDALREAMHGLEEEGLAEDAAVERAVPAPAGEEAEQLGADEGLLAEPVDLRRDEGLGSGARLGDALPIRSEVLLDVGVHAVEEVERNLLLEAGEEVTEPFSELRFLVVPSAAEQLAAAQVFRGTFAVRP